jgi:Uma2 family endonuclease
MSASLAFPRIPDRMILEPVLSNEEFEELCAANENLRLERTSEGVILVNAPAGSATSGGNAEINYQLMAWWRTHRRGRVFDSSIGVFLPDGSAMGPDAAYAAETQARGLRKSDLAHFLPFAPAFVVELLSKTDSVKEAERKMVRWIENGVVIAWLVNPYKRTVTVYEAGGEMRIEAGSKVVGTGPVEGFVLELEDVWRSYELRSSSA